MEEEWRGGGIMTGEREFPAEGGELSTVEGGEVGKEEIGWSGGPGRERSGGSVKNPTLRTFGSLTVLGARRGSIMLEREGGGGKIRVSLLKWALRILLSEREERRFGDVYYSDTVATPKTVHSKRCRFSAFLNSNSSSRQNKYRFNY
ncbi:hypothetical protein OIU76_028056 [Salix suchowensis]|nr:hypothetical protein OIU76_028056 [Salix suchowensis]